MKTLKGTALALFMTMGGWACHAQQVAVLSGQPPEAPQPQVHFALPAEISSGGISTTGVEEFLSGEDFEPAHPSASVHIMDRKFLLLNGLHLGMALVDVEMTQRCLANHHCREGNPFMPSSHGGQLAVVSSLVTLDFGASYQMKKSKMKMWWLAPTGGILTHTIGAVTGMMHQ